MHRPTPEDAANVRLNMAVMFATEKHLGQFRKGNGVPYILHPLEVLKQVASWGITKVAFLDLWVAVVLHDTVEDTDATIEEITLKFGEKTAGYVKHLTFRRQEPEEFGKDYALAKQAYINNFGYDKPIEVVVIKLADRIRNVWDFYDTDLDYARKYYKKADQLVEAIICYRGKIEEMFGVPVYDAISRSLESLEEALDVRVFRPFQR